MWFPHWQISNGTWPQLPNGELNLSQEMKEEIDRCFASALGYSMLMIGEMQALKMLVALQCLAKVGLRRPPPGYVFQCIKSIVHPMAAIGISFTAHAMLASTHRAVPVTLPHWKQMF